jgi:hypothetical protein
MKKTIDPWKVITVWKCPDCCESSEFDVTFFEENGTPRCLKCLDQYLEFDSVYVIESEGKNE